MVVLLLSFRRGGARWPAVSCRLPGAWVRRLRIGFHSDCPSILMAYTVALANSHGRLISELKKQIETVSLAGPRGRRGDRPGLHVSCLDPQESQNKVFLARRAVALSSAQAL